MADQTLVITVDAVEYRLRMRDLSANDAKDFRSKVGMSLAEALNGDIIDIDILAGLVWLKRRKIEQRLTFEQVAGGMNYGGDNTVIMQQHDELTPGPEDDPTNPET